VLAVQNVLDTPVSTEMIWKNISSRFLIPDIPTKTTLEELAKELSCNNDIVIAHMQRFVKSKTLRKKRLQFLLLSLAPISQILLKSGS
ncbi:hypothetical protein AVEN_117620-1, partial [Araneus ventricosus]